MMNYFASSLLDAMGKVLHLHTGTCQYLDRETGKLMWLGTGRFRVNHPTHVADSFTGIAKPVRDNPRMIMTELQYE